jgi:nitrate reductase delta subunit
MNGLDRFAPLFAYPDEGYRDRAEACARESASPGVREFAARLAPLSTGEIQERFVQAFDLNPSSTLEIGWHLFGEQYERGDFLVSLRQRLRDAAIPECGELPDHLLHVLPLVSRLAREDARAFADRFLSPALSKIEAGLPKDSVFVPLVHGLAEETARQG